MKQLYCKIPRKKMQPKELYTYVTEHAFVAEENSPETLKAHKVMSSVTMRTAYSNEVYIKKPEQDGRKYSFVEVSDFSNLISTAGDISSYISLFAYEAGILKCKTLFTSVISIANRDVLSVEVLQNLNHILCVNSFPYPVGAVLDKKTVTLVYVIVIFSDISDNQCFEVNEGFSLAPLKAVPYMTGKDESKFLPFLTFVSSQEVDKYAKQ